MCLFYEEEEPCSLSLSAKRYFSGSVVPKYSTLWRGFTKNKYFFVLVQAKVSIEMYSPHLLTYQFDLMQGFSVDVPGWNL